MYLTHSNNSSKYSDTPYLLQTTSSKYFKSSSVILNYGSDNTNISVTGEITSTRRRPSFVFIKSLTEIKPINDS